MSDLIRLSLATVNAPDAIALARFLNCAEVIRARRMGAGDI